MKKTIYTSTALILMFALLIASTAYSQSQDKADSLPDYSMLPHEYKKYTMAMNWNDSEIARSALYDMIIKSQKSDSLIFALAYLYYEDQKYASSALVCQDLLSRYPKNIDYLRISAGSLETIGVFDKAVENYETIYLLSDNTSALYKVALLQYRLKRYPEGITNIDILLNRPDVKTIKVEFKDEKEKTKEYTLELAVINLKGLLYQKMGKLNKAKEAYEQALKINPDFMPAKKGLATLK